LEDMDSNQMDNKSQKEDFVSRRKIGELLIESGLLTSDKINDALEIQKKTGKRLGEVLIEMKIISEEELAFALAMQLKIPFIDLSTCAIKDDVMGYIPKEVCQKFVCIPVALKDNTRCCYG